MPSTLPFNDDIKADAPSIKGYDTLELIGHGWISSVWKARHASLGRLMAIRVLSESISRNPDVIQRLTSDIKLAASLKHGGLVPVYDFGKIPTTGRYYLTTDYVFGYSLGQWLRRSGRLSESDALVIAYFVADALSYSWDNANLVHGNIKPSNIMINQEGTTQVCDLGLVEAVRLISASPPDTLPPSPDTFQYMSPELISGPAAVDCRSDIYSLGATLYHMLTGKRPFDDPDPSVVRERQIKETFGHPQTLNPSLTVGTARLILKMTAKAPGERYQNWEEVTAAMHGLESGVALELDTVAAMAMTPSPGAPDPSARPQKKFKPIKALPLSGTKPKAIRQEPGHAASERETAGVPRVPVAFPKFKKPVSSFFKSARRSFYVAVAFHGLLLLAAGIVVVSRVFYNRETTFVGQPPPMRSFEPRKLEHRVKVQKRQRSSSRPSMASRLVAMKGSSFALPEIKVDSKAVKTSFSPKFSTVSGVGMGVGLGMGYGLGGFGQGVSAYNFFGIKGRTDRVIILVDVSESMVEDSRDGEAGYQRVKDKINGVIDDLSEQALFNVIAYADAASSCFTNLMIASLENKQKAKEWLAPFNTRGNLGLTTGNLQQSNVGLRALGGTTRLDLALTGAFEEGADTILILSDGLPRVKRELTDQQKEDWDEKIAQWERENAAAIKARASVRLKHADDYKETKVWVPGQPATKRREGVPAREATEGHWEIRRDWGYEGPSLTPRPTPPENLLWWSLTDFITHFTLLHKELYEKKGGKKAPVIHGIGYCIDEAGGDFMKGLAKHFKGNYRLVGGHAKTEEEIANTRRITTKPRKDIKSTNAPPHHAL